MAIGNPVYDFIKTAHSETDKRVLSGCSTNFCLALAKLGVRSTLVGNIGPDFKPVFQTELSRYGINFSLGDAAQSGGFSLRYYGDKGERELTLLGDAGPIRHLPPQLKKADWIVLAPVLGEIDLAYVERIKAESSARIFLDPQGILRNVEGGLINHRKQEETEKLISLCEIIKPNELECRVLTGIDPRQDYRTPAQMIKAWGPEVVVITLAEQGSIIYDGIEFYEIEAYHTAAIDPTGAGDTYAAGFMYGMIRGYGLPECGVLGSAVASVMVEHTGPDFPLTKSEALNRMKKILCASSV